MDKYYSFLQALMASEMPDDWLLFELTEEDALTDSEDILYERFGKVHRIHGTMPIGKYVVVRQDSFLYESLTEAAILFPTCVYQASIPNTLLVFYCLNEG